jgi:hypothetical protein
MRASLFAFFLFLFCNSFAQTYFGNVTLDNQDAVNQFPQQFVGITHINGILTIGTNDTLNFSNINSLLPLLQLQKVQTINVKNNGLLQNLVGLDNIDSVDSYTIYNNPQLSQLQGLQNLKYAYSFTLRKNELISNLHGLEQLEETHFFILENNKNLLSCLGVNSLKSIYYRAEIYSNPRLKSISGFEALEGIAEIFVGYNDSLLHFGYFPHITEAVWVVGENKNLIDFAEVEGSPIKKLYCKIFHNDNFISLKGLNKIDYANISVIDNAIFTDVASLDSVNHINMGIKGPAISSIHLDYPKKVDNFFVTGCPNLKIIENFLPNVDSVFETIKIFENDSLHTVHEDFGPKYIHQFLVQDNPKLEYITGFEGLEEAGPYTNWQVTGTDNFSLQFSSPNFKAISGFNHVKKANLQVRIVGNPNNHFDRIEGFNDLDTIPQLFDIDFSGNYPNPPIYNWQDWFPSKLIGFKNLKSIGKVLSFQSIKDTINAFHNLQTIGLNLTPSSNNNPIVFVRSKSNCYINLSTFNKLEKINESNLLNAWAIGKLFKFPSLKELTNSSIYTLSNDSITNLIGVYPVLKHLTGFGIDECNNLKSLDGIESMREFVKIEDTFHNAFNNITSCDSLSDCSAICHILENATFSSVLSPTFKLDNPLFPCTDLATVLEYCDTVTNITNPPSVSERDKTIKVYPNPVKGELLNIELGLPVSGQYLMRVSDAAGRIVMSGRISIQEGKGAINVSALKSGILYLNLSKGIEVYGVGFVKESY